MVRPGLVLLVFSLAWLSFLAPSGRAQSDEGADDVHPVVGSWLVEVEVDGASTLLLPNLVSFTSDGIVLVAAPTLLPELPGPDATLDLFSSGHGAWTATDPDSAEVRFVFLVVDAQGRPSSINIVDGALQVDDGRDT